VVGLGLLLKWAHEEMIEICAARRTRPTIFWTLNRKLLGLSNRGILEREGLVDDPKMAQKWLRNGPKWLRNGPE